MNFRLVPGYSLDQRAAPPLPMVETGAICPVFGGNMFDAQRRLPAVAAMVATSLSLAPSNAASQASSTERLLASLRPPSPPEVFFPDRAQRMGIDGKAVINCAADASGVLTDCNVVSETPGDWDFGVSALKAARARSIRRMAPAADGRVSVTVAFDAKEGRVRGGAPGLTAGALRRAAGPAPAASLAAPGESIVTFPFAFTRTAVLTQDLTYADAKGARARAGAPGFLVGNFTLSRPGIAPRWNMWCFLSWPESQPADWACSLVQDSAGSNEVRSTAVEITNPYDVTAIKKLGRASRGPVFEERQVAIPGDLRLEYRFKRWTLRTAEIEVRAGGRWSSDLALPRRADGSALLETPAALYRLTPAPGEATKAEIVEEL